MVEKLSVSFWFMASMAVMIPTRAMMPKAMMATVRPVRSLLLRTVLEARERMSEKFMDADMKVRRKLEAGGWSVGIECRISNVECRMSNIECRTRTEERKNVKV